MTATMTRVVAPRDAERLDRVLAPVRQELESVTDRLLSQLTDPVARTVVYLITAGGKRLRPAMVLLAGAAGTSPNDPALIDTAAAVELIHTATLIHDDIIDQSPLRRSHPAFHHQWGTERAVLMGDYLYATAFTMLARLDQPAVMQIMADVCRQLCRGELREVEARFRLDLTEPEYFAIIEDKTGSLIGGCCRCGAHLGGCASDAVERLGRFGAAFGLVFQIIDDCLDLTGDQAEVGKPLLADADKGVLSLPLIYLTQALSARERAKLFAPLARAQKTPGLRGMDQASLRRVAKAAQESGAIDRATDRARVLMHEANGLLAGVPMNGLTETYQQLADYAVTRRS